MVAAIRYETTIQETRSTAPVAAAMAGSAVATMVWSTTARNIGSINEGKTAKKAGCCADVVSGCSGACNGSSFRSSRPAPALSVGHQHRQRRIGQDVPRGSAENHLTQPALRIGALDQQIAA